MIAEVQGDEIVSLHPNREHPVYRGFCCNKGLGMDEVHRDPDRLNRPLRRISPKGELPARFEPVGWEQAIGDIAARLNEIRSGAAGGDGIALYRGNPLSFNAVGVRALAAFATKIGSRMCFGPTTQDCSNKMAASEALFGHQMLHPIPDLEHTDYFLNFGSNPKVSKLSLFHTPHPHERIRDVVRRGGKVLHINSRHIESATPATGDVLPIKPDTDVYLMAALLHEIHEARGFQEELLKAHAVNMDGLVAFVRQYPAERVAAITGIPAPRIKAVAGEFAGARSASVYMSTGVNMGRQGTLAYWLLMMLSLVTGNLGRRGGNIVTPGFGAPVKLGIESGADPWFESPAGRLRHIAGCLPGTLLADMILAETNPVRALIVVSGNPVLSIPGEDRLREAFDRLDLLVSIDIYPSATTEHADYILPGVDMLERRDINLVNNGFQPQPFAQYTDAVVRPAAERQEEWRIIAALEQAMGLPSLLDEPQPDPFREIDGLIEGAGLSISALRAMPHQTHVMPPPKSEDTLARRLNTGKRKIDCCPASFGEALTRAEEIFCELLDEPAGLLKLVSRRTIHMHNSWLSNVKAAAREAARRNPLWMHPEDAADRGLDEGDRVRVHNPSGSVVAEIGLDDTLLRGVVAMTHGRGNDRTPGLRIASSSPGVNVNRLLPSGPGSFDVLSNQAFMTGVPVRVDRVE